MVRRTGEQIKRSLRITHRDYLHLYPLATDVIDFLGSCSGCIVDFGCGQMPYRQFCPDSVTEYIGLDADENNRASDIQCGAESTPLPDDRADHVLCLQVLEHVPDPLAVLREINRVLSPGGTALITVPQAWELHEAPHDYFRYTQYGMVYLLEKAGLQACQITKHGTDLSLLGLKLNRVISRARLIGHLGFLVYPLVNCFLGILDRNNGNDIINLGFRCRSIEKRTKSVDATRATDVPPSLE